MSYENEISHLRAGLEESKRLYSEAVRKQLHTDVEIWADDIKHLKYQIIVHAKAEAFDEIVEERNQAVKTMYKRESLERYAIDRAFWNVDGIIADYESEAE